MSRGAVWLERLAVAVCALALSIGLILLLAGYFAGRDQASVTGAGGRSTTQTVPLHGHPHPAGPRPRPVLRSSAGAGP